MKIGGQIKITYEMLNAMLCLPEGCKIVSVIDDPRRDLVAFKFHAAEERRGAAYQIGEGMEYPTIDITVQDQAKRAIRIAREVEEQAANPDRRNDWARQVLEHLDSNE